jgi:hypothetical protein
MRRFANCLHRLISAVRQKLAAQMFLKKDRLVSAHRHSILPFVASYLLVMSPPNIAMFTSASIMPDRIGQIIDE